MATTKGVFREPLAIPVVQSFGPTPNFKLYDNHINTLNKGLLSVAQTISTMHAKVTELEKVATANENLRQRVDTLEKTLNAQAKLLSDIHGMLNKVGGSQKSVTPQKAVMPMTQQKATQKAAIPQKTAMPTPTQKAATPLKKATMPTATQKTTSPQSKPLVNISAAVREEIEEAISTLIPEEGTMATSTTVEPNTEAKVEVQQSSQSELIVTSTEAKLEDVPHVEAKLEVHPEPVTVSNTNTEAKAEVQSEPVTVSNTNTTETVQPINEPATVKDSTEESDDEPTMDAMLSALGVDPKNLAKKNTSAVIEDDNEEIEISESASDEEVELTSEPASESESDDEEEELKVSKVVVKPVVTKPIPKPAERQPVKPAIKPIAKQNPIAKKK